MSGFFGGGSVASMAEATSSAAGAAGLVPAPAAGEEHKILRGDATFQGVPWGQKLVSSSTSDVSLTGTIGNVIGLYGLSSLSSTGNQTFYYVRQYFTPVFIPQILTSWNLNVTIGANPLVQITCKIGVYDRSTATNLPNNRISVSSAITVATTDTGVTKTVAFTDTLNTGLYYLSACGGTNATALPLQAHNTTIPLPFLGIQLRTGAAPNCLYKTITGYGTDDFASTMGTTSWVANNGDFWPRMWISY
ncbi:MAG: hypothetical protein EBZ61_09920 [Micrococcales bacterium]|nr:hypothetical protein [Micrococcales bacterium]